MLLQVQKLRSARTDRGKHGKENNARELSQRREYLLGGTKSQSRAEWSTLS